MNHSLTVFLLNKNARAMKTRYEADPQPGQPDSLAMHKTLDPDLKAGDLVIVPTGTRQKMTVVKIVETDVDVDFDSSANVDWIIARVDRSEYDQVVSQEAQALSIIRKGEVQKKREALMESALAGQQEVLKALPIAAMNGDAVKPQTPLT